jgi:hypothetical protein
LFMWIFKNVLHGLKSQGKEDMNGWRFALLQASSSKNWTF